MHETKNKAGYLNGFGFRYLDLEFVSNFEFRALNMIVVSATLIISVSIFAIDSFYHSSSTMLFLASVMPSALSSKIIAVW